MKFIICTAVLLAGFGLALASEQPSPPEQCYINNRFTGKQHRLDCLLDPESVEGPYYLPLSLHRSDITEGKPGTPLGLTLVVMNNVTCEPIANATVDIWHASWDGVYSGFEQEGTLNETWLRGVQVTNASGEVYFVSAYPGWYTGRCVHIHIEVFVGGSLKHTGQLFFTNDLTTATRFVPPYSTRTDLPVRNENDGIFNGDGGMYTTFDDPAGDVVGGLQANMYIGINPNATPEQRPIVHFGKD